MRFFQLYLLFILALSSAPVVAAETLVLNHSVSVFLKPKFGLSPWKTLSAGEKLRLSSRNYKGWRKILIIEGGNKKIGWVWSDDLLEKRPESSVEATFKPQRFSSRWSMGLQMITSYMYQGERTLSLSDEVSTYKVTPLKSTTFWFEVFADLPLGKRKLWGLRAFVNRRRSEFKGSANLEESTSQDSSGDLKMDHSFLGVGVTLKKYLSEPSRYWWGLGLEASQGTSISIDFAGETLPVEEGDKPFYWYSYGAFGGEYHLYLPYFLTLEGKLGVVSNVNPRIYIGEIHCGIAYRF